MHNRMNKRLEINKLVRNKTVQLRSVRSFIKRQTSGTSSDNEWYNKWQRATTIGKTSDNECQRVTSPANFSFFFK